MKLMEVAQIGVDTLKKERFLVGVLLFGAVVGALIPSIVDNRTAIVDVLDGLFGQTASAQTGREKDLAACAASGQAPDDCR